MVKFASRNEGLPPRARANTQKLAPTFAWPVRVFYEDTDAGGVVYYANYLRFMERARTEWLRELGFEHASFEREHGALFIVRAVAVKYLKPAALDDRLTVTATPAWRSAYQIHLEQDVMRASAPANVVLARANVAIACVDSASFKPKTLPPALIAKLDGLE
jgi:acyl-CoA thioester hydrolase